MAIERALGERIRDYIARLDASVVRGERDIGTQLTTIKNRIDFLHETDEAGNIAELVQLYASVGALTEYPERAR